MPGYGGAGQTTDWAWAAAAVQQLAGLEVWLAGGITPANAAQAIAQVRPAGLDVASGTELPGARRGRRTARRSWRCWRPVAVCLIEHVRVGMSDGACAKGRARKVMFESTCPLARP
ncbi:hypothetical protein [Nannocystis pusilla]|uniref:phosphoribosylanthranilate isomerase n=1 Tax=Nannocystis pusilla TaxID=889268 RepID=UPI003B79EE3E